MFSARKPQKIVPGKFPAAAFCLILISTFLSVSCGDKQKAPSETAKTDKPPTQPPLVTPESELNETAKTLVPELSCVSCHKPQFKFWQGTRHAGAMADLIAEGKRSNDPHCVKCHSKSYVLNPGGELDFAATYPTGSDVPNAEWFGPNPGPDGKIRFRLPNVNCGWCHEVTVAHTRNPKANLPKPRYAEQDCLRCHVAEHSEEFIYEKRLPLVRH